MMLDTAAAPPRTPIYIDLRSLQRPITTSLVASAIFSRLGYEATSGDRKEFLAAANRPVPPLALALDEFDLVEADEVHSLLGFLVQVLPGTIQVVNWRYGAESSTAIFIGSRQSLFDLERATHCIDSPWYQNFRTLNLRPLAKTEATRLIFELSRPSGMPLTNDAAWLITFAGTWPFHLKLASHYAYEFKKVNRRSILSKRERETIEERVWEEALPHLAGYWAGLSSRQRDLLANLGLWLRMGSEGRFDPDIMKLTRDGVLARSRGRVEYTCALFKSFFRRQASAEGLTGHSVLPSDIALTSIAQCLARLGSCTAELSNWDDSKETNIQELAYVVLRSQYHRVSRERIAGEGPRRDYRVDLRVEDVDVLVEVKRVRGASHSQQLQAELNDDIVGYRSKNPGQRIVFLIWDTERWVGDREYFVDTYERKDAKLRIVFAP